MICPFCLNNKTKVSNSRSTKKLAEIWRRRQCLKCQKQFSTRESVDLSTVLNVKNSSNESLAFSRIKLLSSLIKAIDHVDNLDEKAHWILESIQRLLITRQDKSNSITTQDVRDAATTVLKKYDYPAYVKYSTSLGIKVKR